MDIDFSMNGAEAVAAKANNLAKSMGKLESAWSKYNRSVANKSVQRLFSGKGGGKSGGSTAASILGSAATFLTIQKIMEKLVGDKVKDWTTALVNEDIKRWKAIGKGISNFVTPIMKRVALRGLIATAYLNQLMNITGGGGKLLSRLSAYASGAGGLIAGFAARQYKKLPGGLRLGITEGIMGATVFGRLIKTIVRTIAGKTPISLMAAAVAGAVLMDERAYNALGKLFDRISNGVGRGVTYISDKVSSLWGGFKIGLARFTNNAYYAGSQVNRAEALQKLTPEQQLQYIASEEKRLRDSDWEEFIIRTRKELMELFETENKKRNEQIIGIYDSMVYQGRL